MDNKEQAGSVPYGLDAGLRYNQFHIINSLTEGILVMDTSGTILYVNNAAYDIMNLSPDEVKGQKFANLFVGDLENDAFVQIFLDAVYTDAKNSESVVPYVYGGKKKQLRVHVAFLPKVTAQKDGYVMALTDLSELLLLRDAAQDMQRVSSLNHQLTLRNELLQKSFGMYLSDSVVQELLKNRHAPVLGGAKKNLTIMMSDLRGFTALSEQMDAKDLIDLLNHYLGVMTDMIQKYGGTIIEFIGDGILAIFGAPVDSPAHAEYAVCAAIEMQAVMERVNQWNARRGYPALEMGIGLNTGDVIVGNVGSPKRMKYGVVGSHVNLCGRIESYTTAGQILISPETREAISSPLKIEREIVVSPKGVGKELVLSQVSAIGAPYHVSVKVRHDTPKPLDNPFAVCFCLIHDKHIEDVVHYGGFTALGRDTAILNTEADLKIYDNIRVRAGGELLCKVVDDRDGAYLLKFTSIPAGFQAWVKAQK